MAMRLPAIRFSAAVQPVTGLHGRTGASPFAVTGNLSFPTFPH